MQQCTDNKVRRRIVVMEDLSCRSVEMPKKKTGQRKKHDKMKARQKEIGLRGERKDHLNIAERYNLCTLHLKLNMVR